MNMTKLVLANPTLIGDKEMANKDDKLNFIPDYVKKISIVPLTLAGQVQLTAYPERAIMHAIHCAKRKDISDHKKRFFYMRSACQGYCRDNNIPIHSDIVSKLNKYYNLPTTADFVVTDNTNGATTTQPRSSTHNTNTLNKKDDAVLHKDTLAFIARENRELVRKEGLNVDRYDELLQLYRNKRLEYRHRRH